MHRQQVNMMGISLLFALLVVGLVAKPAQADDYGDVIVPLATGVVLGAMLYHGDRHHYQYSKRRYNSYAGHHRYGNGHGGYRQRVRSHSYGGYSRGRGEGEYKPQSRRKRSH